MLSISRQKLVRCISVLAVAILAYVLYFYKLAQVPNGLYVDEAVTGYNAYSLLLTGKDEYGKAFPVAMRFLGSYSPPLYTYLTVPAVAVFGLDVFAVRFISALSGVLGAVVIYLFLESVKEKFFFRYSPLLGTLFFAISPWAALFGRTGYETNLGFFLFSLGVYFMWLGLKNPKIIIAGLVVLSVSTYAYHTQKFLVPIFLSGFILLFGKELLGKTSVKYLITGLLVSLLVQVPNLLIINTPAFFARGSLFYARDIVTQSNKMNHFLPSVISLPAASLYEFFSRYMAYFSPKSLFSLPDPDLQRSIPELSVLYPWMVIPLAVGLWFLIRHRTAFGKYCILLLLVSPVPAALTGDPFSTQRAMPMLLPLILAIAFGVDQIVKKLTLKTSLPIFFAVSLFSLLMLWRSYFVFLPKERAAVWGYGYSQLASYIGQNAGTRFLIDQSRIKPAYIMLAFFTKYPPQNLQEAVNPQIRNHYYSNIPFDSKYEFANIRTRAIVWEEDIYTDQIIIGDKLSVSATQAREHFLTKVFEVKDPMGEVVFRGFKTNPPQKCLKSAPSRLCKTKNDKI